MENIDSLWNCMVGIYPQTVCLSSAQFVEAEVRYYTLAQRHHIQDAEISHYAEMQRHYIDEWHYTISTRCRDAETLHWWATLHYINKMQRCRDTTLMSDITLYQQDAETRKHYIDEWLMNVCLEWRETNTRTSVSGESNDSLSRRHHIHEHLSRKTQN